VNSDGSNNSTLVEMLMRSSPARALRPRVGSSSEITDGAVLHVAAGPYEGDHNAPEEADGDGIGNDDSESDDGGKRHVTTSSRYDYDASWKMGGHRSAMVGSPFDNCNVQQQEADSTVATSTASQTSGVLSEAVAASAAVAAVVNSSDARPITPAGLVSSTSAAISNDHSHSTPRQQRRARPLAESQSSLPASPIHLVPRRRTRSTPNAGSAYMVPSPNQPSGRKRRAYAYQKYHAGEALPGGDSIDMGDEFDDVRNISPTVPNTDDIVADNPFDDFDGAPSVPRVGTALNREESSTSTSSSSSITHRRRRGPGSQIDPSGTTIYGQSAASVSSFSGSVSTATATGASLHPPGQGRALHHDISVARAGDSSRASADSEETDTNINPAARSLRASLDAGMAAISRWARSHAGVAGSAAASAAQAGGHGPPRSSRAAIMQLGEEDLFALANAGADPRRSVSALEEEERQGGVGGYGLGGLSVFAPIAEEDEGIAVAGRNRDRAFSEPDRARVRNFFSRRAINREGSSPQRSNQSRFFGTTPGAAQIGGDVISHLSSSTDIASGARTLSTAAMSSSLFHSSSTLPPQATARVIGANAGRNVADQIDLIERGSIPTDGSMEGVVESSSREGNETPRGDVIVPSSSHNQGGNEGEDERQQPQATTGTHLDRQARRRWVRINQRFQVLITFVALIFSLILFAVLVCWIVMTSSYVVSIDKPCDVPLKKYFWLATLQLVFDVFRTDIMRHILRWDPNQGQQIPKRVVIYNMAYLIYAICVLRIGVKSVYFSPESTCPDSAPEFYSAAAAFVTLSLAAWSTIVVGYLFPFCFVAIILTRNGYSPSADIEGGEEAINAAIPGVFPNYHAHAGAPPGCIDRLQVIMLHEFPDDYPRECCICMSDFSDGEVIVVTNCEHVFHKRCCQEWLQQARTCPVCRTDIPTALDMSEHGSEDDGSWDGDPSRPRPNRPPLNREEFHQEVVSLLRLLRQHEERIRDRLAHPEDEREDDNGGDQRSEGGTSDNITNQSGDLEEGRMEREESTSLPSYRSRRSY